MLNTLVSSNMRGSLLFATLIILPMALAAPSKTAHRYIARHFHHRAAQDNTQMSLTLDKSQVQAGLKKNGQQDPAENQVASLTSSNNFINFCLTQKDVPLTNGAQVKDGSCNPTVMGRIVAQNVMPSSKFVFPPNLDDTLKENETFIVKMAVNNLQTGNFVNAEANYFAAPSQVNEKGHLIGHSHVVIQAISSLDSTDIPDPTEFVFFQGLNEKAENGILSANVVKGLPAGTYRMGSINTAANHQPALVSVAQHGMLDDIVYFTVKKAHKNGKKAISAQHTRDATAATKISGSCTSKTEAGAEASETTMNHQGGPRLVATTHASNESKWHM